MTAEEFQTLVNNQKILAKKLDGITSELNSVKRLVDSSISNQQLLEQYEMDITERLKRIENKIK